MLYILACHGNDYLNNLLGSTSTNTAEGWTIDCNKGVWNHNLNGICSNWYGWSNTIGSVSTNFNVKGRARLDFGNCNSGNSGIVNAYLDENLIASAPKDMLSKTVEFDFNIGSNLMITEENGAIIQFNSLHITQCNEDNSEY